MVTRSRAREGRGISVVPEIEFRPKTKTRPELKTVTPMEIQVSLSAICEEGLGATVYLSDTASQYVTANKPETTTGAFVMVEAGP